MFPRAANWGLGLGLLVACGETAPLRSPVEVPAMEGSASVVLGLQTRTGLELHALDADGQGRVEIGAARLAPEAAHFAVGLGPSLESLGLEEGPLPASAELGLRIFDGPAGVKAWSLETETWRDTGRSDLPEAVLDYRLPGTSCGRLGQAVLLHRGRGRARFALPLDDRRVLVGLQSETLVVTATSATVLSRAELGGAFAPPHGTRAGAWIWLADALGRVYAGPASFPLALELVEAPTASAVGGFGGSDGQDVFLVERSDPPRLHRRMGESWAPLGEIPAAEGAPVGFAPGRAVLRAEAVGLVYVLEPDGATAEDVGGVAFQSVGFAPGLGALGGTTDGTVLVRAERRWRQLPGPAFGWWVIALSEAPGGFLSVLASGSLVRWVGRLPCSDLSFRGSASSSRVRPLGDGVILVAAIDGMAEVLYLPPGS